MTEIMWMLFLSCINTEAQQMCEGNKQCMKQVIECSLDSGQLCYQNGMDIVIEGNHCRQFIDVGNS